MSADTQRDEACPFGKGHFSCLCVYATSIVPVLRTALVGWRSNMVWPAPLWLDLFAISRYQLPL
ncbi:hypothetical protein E4U47_003762 [Claviceps purpurea]|nr:hypothetical protein E4U47_003762 [Claviceps purpurea]